MYEVINFFTDLKDFNYPYHAGDYFPRNGLKVSDERLRELSGSNNRQNKPLIRLVEESEEKKEVKHTRTEISRMSTSALRDMAKNNGIANADDMTGTKLKKMFFEIFEL